MSSDEIQRAVVTVGSSRVRVFYPRRLGEWLDDLVGRARDDAITVARITETRATEAWVALSDDSAPERFRVATSKGDGASGLGLGDALAVFWEHLTGLVIDGIADAIALHAAAVCRDDDLVLLPGSSGAGKTQLALWYRAHGYALATDELVTLAPAREDADALRAHMLARPLFIKQTTDAGSILPAEGLRVRHGLSGGEMLLVDDVAPRPAQQVARGLIVFPHYSAGSPLHLTALTPAQAGLRLLGQCVNVRNLPGGGLALAAAAARHLPAISLRYSDTRQLTGTLDVLTRQLLAASPTSDDLAALCESFTARSSSRPVAVSANTPTPLHDSSTCLAQPTQKARRLTIGMATYDEYDGVYFTVQSIRVHHPELAGAIEFIVVDNNPGGPCSEALKQLGNWIDGYRYVPLGERQGTAVRDAVFEEAGCDIVMCVDPHVLIVPGALARLIDYFQAVPDSRDLVQGPLLYDDLRTISTHFEPQWRAGMYGVWACDPRGGDPDAPPFEIPMQGLGLFACRRAAWPGFNPTFRGFGGEEGYIHEKIRRRGGRTLCLPFLRWVHRFARPLGIPYANRWDDRMRNYFIGFTELGLDTAALEAHFAELLGTELASRTFAETRAMVSARPSRMDVPAETVEKDESGRIPPSDEIFSPHNFSFGDQWATINFYLNMSLMQRRRIRVASLLNGVSLHRLHREILDVLDSPGEVELTLAEPTVGIDGYNVWSAPYFPTKRRWDGGKRHRYVCMQFDGQSAPDAKNPSLEEELLIRRFLEARCHGLEPITLGKHLSVQECVDIAADSALFVGVDSGMSHLCHSVGVPIFLLEYGLPTITVHNGKAHFLCRGCDDFVCRFDRYINYVHAAGLPDAQDIRKADQNGAAPASGTAQSSSPMDAGDDRDEGQHSCLSLPDREAADGGIQGLATPHHAWITRILSLLTPYAVIGASKIRIGGENDGGYLMIDDLGSIRHGYSFGIGADVSWDVHMAQRGVTVFQYDHTISVPPEKHEYFRFSPIGIAAVDDRNVRTIQTLLEQNGHASETELILKMDVEGAEWEVWDGISPLTLSCFKQIICEFHGLSGLRDSRWSKRAERVFQKLSSTHLPVHVHGNNFSAVNIVEGVPIPDVLEVTYARRSSYAFEPSAESFPIELDRPNNPHAPDIYLGRFEF